MGWVYEVGMGVRYVIGAVETRGMGEVKGVDKIWENTHTHTHNIPVSEVVINNNNNICYHGNEQPTY